MIMLKYLIEKEYKQLFRNAFLPRLIIFFPVFMMLILPWAANMEVKNVVLNVVDSDHSVTSDRLIREIASSGYFRLNGVSASYNEAMLEVEKGETDVVMEIAPDFEKNLVQGGRATILVAANTINGTKGSLGSSYLSVIINDYVAKLRGEHPATASVQVMPMVNITSQMLFNPNLDYKVFIVPGLMVILLTLICGFLPALNIVGEKEAGTIEQINVTPVSKFTFIVAKLLPYWSIGLVILTICFGLAWLFYGIFPVGHLLNIYLFSMVYILAVSGFGLVISNNSSTMQQAMFVMFFFMIIFMLMSGLYTPISSMPRWAQVITWFNPLRYMVEVMRMVYLKGSGFLEMLPQLWVLTGFAVFFNGWAVLSYRKNA